MQTSIKVLLFKANIGWDSHMEFKMRKRGKFEKAKEFTTRMKKVYEEVCHESLQPWLRNITWTGVEPVDIRYL